MKRTYLAGITSIVLLLISCHNPTATNTLEQKKAQDTIKTTPTSATLEQVFADSTYQLTGVAVAPGGRLFTNYPYWLDTHSYSVAEVVNGQPVPYPDATWNSFKKGDNGQNKFVCVQSVVADDKGYLWVVDAAGIGLSSVYAHSNKVVKINLATNVVEKIYRFPENVAGANVYLNDIRIDNTNGFAYMTSSSGGGIVVLNIQTGTSRFVLGNSSTVKSDTSYHFSPNGKALLKADGTALTVNSDGIALTPDNQWLYFKPLTDNKLYRISTTLLRDFTTPFKTLDEKVEDLGKFVTTDGMIFDKAGNLYLGDLEQNSIIKITPDLTMHTLLQDNNNLRWPDSYSISEDGYLYISCSQIQYMPWFHQQDEIKRPFKIFRLKI